MERIGIHSLYNDGPDRFTVKGLGDISFLQTMDDLNPGDPLKGFKRRQV